MVTRPACGIPAAPIDAAVAVKLSNNTFTDMNINNLFNMYVSDQHHRKLKGFKLGARVMILCFKYKLLILNTFFYFGKETSIFGKRVRGIRSQVTLDVTSHSLFVSQANKRELGGEFSSLSEVI